MAGRASVCAEPICKPSELISKTGREPNAVKYGDAPKATAKNEGAERPDHSAGSGIAMSLMPILRSSPLRLSTRSATSALSAPPFMACSISLPARV